MADTLLIHFNPTDPDYAVWSLANSQGELTSMLSRGSLTDAAAIASKHKVVVLLDSTCLHLNKVKLPTQNRQKMLRAVPYALEEHIAEDVEDFHFVVGQSDENNFVPVAGIKHNALRDLLNAMDNAGIQPEAIIPDALCLTASSDQWAILLHEDRAYSQFDKLNGSLIDRDMLPVIIDTGIKQETLKAPDKAIIFIQDGDSAQQIDQSLPDSVDKHIVTYNSHPLVVFCGQYKNAMPLNLLQDAYKPRSKANAQWHHWKLAASISAIWLTIHLISAGFELYQLKKHNQKLYADIENTYKRTFPGSKKIVNPRVQMEQKLKELKGNKGGENDLMLALLSESAPALSREKDITIQSIDFRNNQIEIEIIGTKLQAVESLNKSLNDNKNIKSEITSATSEKNQVKGSLRIQAQST